MIYDIDKIDFIRFDNKKTITLCIYDINAWNNEKEIQEHMDSAKKKIEAYLNYILTGSALDYFKLSNNKKYSYIIEFIPEPMQVPVSYVTMLDDYATQIHQNFGETISLDVNAFKEKVPNKIFKFISKFLKK